jgi:hypothetical protein
MDTHDDDSNAYEDWINRRVNGLLRYEADQAAKDRPMTSYKSLEEWAFWVSEALSYETGVRLSQKQEFIILQGFFYAFRQRGFDMCYCPEEAEACHAK